MRLEVVKAKEPSRAARRAASPGALVATRRAEAEAEARRLVVEARREAAAIVAEATACAAEIRERALLDGRAEGERRWSEAALELAGRRTEAAAAVERGCVQLALAVARQIVRAELALDPAAVDEIARRACAPLRRDAQLVLRLSPEDCERAERIRARLGERGPVAVVPDDALEPGECVAECAGVRVDATLSAQLEAVERRLLAELQEEGT